MIIVVTKEHKMPIKHKVAVIDDDLEMGRVVKEVLTEEGYEVWQFGSAAEALVRFKKETPHILITDNKMKDIDGLMFLKKIQSDYPEIVSIMMTAFGSIDTAIQAMKLGAFHYIIKPFKNDELVLLVKRGFENVKLKNENKVLKRELNKSFNLERASFCSFDKARIPSNSPTLRQNRSRASSTLPDISMSSSSFKNA